MNLDHYKQKVALTKDALAEAEGDLLDARHKHDEANKAVESAEHELEQHIMRTERLNTETGLPYGCEVLAATGARECVYSDGHLIRVSPAHNNPLRWLMVVLTPRGECMIQQWS